MKVENTMENTNAVELGRLIADQTEFILRANMATHSKANAITTLLTGELNLRTYDSCGQVDQKTVDIEYMISVVLERLIAKWETTQALYNRCRAR